MSVPCIRDLRRGVTPGTLTGRARRGFNRRSTGRPRPSIRPHPLDPAFVAGRDAGRTVRGMDPADDARPVRWRPGSARWRRSDPTDGPHLVPVLLRARRRRHATRPSTPSPSRRSRSSASRTSGPDLRSRCSSTTTPRTGATLWWVRVDGPARRSTRPRPSDHETRARRRRAAGEVPAVPRRPAARPGDRDRDRVVAGLVVRCCGLRARRTHRMKYRRLGRTALRVSELCLGTMNFGPLTTQSRRVRHHGPRARARHQLLRHRQPLRRRQGPGRDGEIVGNWFAQGGGRREKVVLATKVFGPMTEWPNDGGLSARHIRAACDASLRRLQTDHIDLYQMHHIDRAAPWDEVWQAMETLVAQGKVIYVGSSNFAGWHIAQANEAAARRHFLGLVSEQSLYNLMARTVELEVLPACRGYGLGVIPWSPLAGGMLGGAARRDDAAGARTCSPRYEKATPAARTLGGVLHGARRGAGRGCARVAAAPGGCHGADHRAAHARAARRRVVARDRARARRRGAEGARRDLPRPGWTRARGLRLVKRRPTRRTSSRSRGARCASPAHRRSCSTSGARPSSTSSSTTSPSRRPIMRAVAGPACAHAALPPRRIGIVVLPEACARQCAGLARDDDRQHAERHDVARARRRRPRAPRVGREPRLPRLPRVAVPGRRPRPRRRAPPRPRPATRRRVRRAYGSRRAR